MLISLCRPWVSLSRTRRTSKCPPDRASTAVSTALTRLSKTLGSHPAGQGHDLHALLADSLGYERTAEVVGDLLARMAGHALLPGDDPA